MLGHEPMHALHLPCTAGDHREFRVTAFQIELADDAVVTLLDQKHARAGFQLLLDQLEFALAQAETARVLLVARVGVRKEHLGGRLLDEGAADGAVEHVARDSESPGT